MPTPTDQQQGNIVVALVGAIGGAIGLALGGAFNWLISRVNKSAVIQVKQLDKPGEFTDDLQAELTRLTNQGIAQAAALQLYDEKQSKLRDDFSAHLLASGRKEIEGERKIAHLETEIEKLMNKISVMEGEKASIDKAHSDEIEQLKGMIAARDATIVELRQQIADFQKIGVLEPPPPKRKD